MTELLECPRCGHEDIWVSRLATPCCEREIFVKCCQTCGEMSVFPESQKAEARDAADRLQQERDAGWL